MREEKNRHMGTQKGIASAFIMFILGGTIVKVNILRTEYTLKEKTEVENEWIPGTNICEEFEWS